MVRAHNDKSFWKLETRVDGSGYVSGIHISSVRGDTTHCRDRLCLEVGKRLYFSAKIFRVAGIKLSGDGRVADGDGAHERLLSEERFSWLRSGWRGHETAPRFSRA